VPRAANWPATLGWVAGLLAERRRVAREGLDVIAWTGHRHTDHESIRRRILRDYRQDVAEQIAVG
jgi:hypothetical protein